MFFQKKFLIKFNKNLWRNGSALDSKSKGCRFKSCQVHLNLIFFFNPLFFWSNYCILQSFFFFLLIVDINILMKFSINYHESFVFKPSPAPICFFFFNYLPKYDFKRYKFCLLNVLFSNNFHVSKSSVIYFNCVRGNIRSCSSH